METITPGLMTLRVQGLEAPLELSLHESEVVLRCKVRPLAVELGVCC